MAHTLKIEGHPRCRCRPAFTSWLICLLVLSFAVPLPGAAQQTPPAPGTPPALKTRIIYLGKKYPEPPPLSLLEKILTDEGVQGVRQGFKDINTTGRLIGHAYELSEVIVEESGDVAEKAKDLLSQDARLIVADLEAADLLKLADVAAGTDAIIMDARTRDDELRQADCRANVFHTSPNWAKRQCQ